MQKRYRKHPLTSKLPDASPAVVEASAGTGKTRLIESRVIDLLLEKKVRPRNLVIISHSNTAAHEIRVRIGRAIDDLLAGNVPPAGPREPYWEINADGMDLLQDARIHLQDAFIGTIHSYMYSLMRGFPLALNLSATLDLREVNSASQMDTAKVLRELPAKSPLFTALLDEKKVSSDELKGLISQAQKLSRNRRDLYPRLTGHMLDDFTKRFAKTWPKSWVKYFKDAEYKVQAEKKPLSQKLLDHLTKVVDFGTWLVTHGAESLENRDLVTEFLKKAYAFSEEDKRLGTDHSQIKFIFKDKKAQAAFDATIRIIDHIPSVASLCLSPMVDAFRSEYDNGLWLNGEIGFADMVLSIVDASKGSDWPKTVSRMRESVTDALVDEFQDTNVHQWEAIRSLFLDHGAIKSGFERLCLVGDPKQSIFSYSGVHEALFVDAREETKKLRGQHLTLDTNFRSTPDFVQACNALFSDFEGHSFFGKSISYTPVNSGNSELDLSRNGSKVSPICFHRIDGSKTKPSKEDFNALYAHMIANQIAHDTGIPLGRHNGTPRIDTSNTLMYRESRNNHLRPITYSDIFILVSTHKDGLFIHDFLTGLGIPVQQHTTHRQLQALPEAQDVFHLLKAVSSPSDIRLIRMALISPLLAVPLRRVGGLAGSSVERDIQEQCGQWKHMADHHRLPEMLCSIQSLTGILARSLFAGGDLQSYINYRHVFGYLGRLSQRPQSSLEMLLECLEKDEVDDDTEGDSLGEELEKIVPGANRVQVMTIHRAKGRQSPIVYLFGGLGSRDSHVAQDGFYDGKFVTLYNEEASSPAMKKSESDRQLENQRLAYVAVTRAKCRAYIPIVPANYAPTKSGYLTQFRDWLRDITERLDKSLFETTSLDYNKAQEITAEHHERIAMVNQGGLVFSPEDEDEEKDIDWEEFGPPRLRIDPIISEPISDRSRTTPIRLISYTSIVRAQGEESEDELEPGADERHPTDPETVSSNSEVSTPEVPSPRIYRGRSFGIMVHSAFDMISPESYREYKSFAAWIKAPEVASIFSHLGTLHRIDPDGQEAAARMVYAGMTSPINIASTVRLEEGLRSVEDRVSEASLLFPVREKGTSSVRTMVTGSVDFTFRHDGKIYFCDWKTDLLDPQILASQNVLDAYLESSDYMTQAKVYTLALVKALRIRDQSAYDVLFGGFVYCYVRHMAEGAPCSSVYSRLSWDEVQDFEKSLMTKEAA